MVIAPGRRGIGGVRAGGLPVPEGRCPFCRGHEADTEETIAAWPSEDWKVRVVRNKYPIAPAHEVLVESDEHGVDLADLALDHASAVLRTLRDRVRALEREPEIASVIVFRNRGRRAGSSQPHPHTQIVGLPWIPADLERRARIDADHLRARGERVHEAALRRELEDRVRVIAEDERYVVFAPYAPSRPFEVRIAPRVAGAFTDVEELPALQLLDALGRLRRAIDLTDYNVILRLPPARVAGSWHLEILPRLGGDAGYELATGEMIVVVSPEDAADALRAGA